MLNLSDIRKKANKKGKKRKSPKRPETKKPEEVSSPDSKVPSLPAEEPTDAEEAAVPLATTGEPEKTGSALDTSPAPEPQVQQVEIPSADESAGGGEAQDPLESLFSANPELELATEETYFEGLVGQERETEEDLCQLLSFALGEEEYAVNIQDVQEIIKLREMTDIPRVPGFVLGIISLRGNIIPVFDLKRRLQLGTVEPTPSTRIVVCRDGRKAVGLVVDRINQVVRLPEKAVEQVSGILSGVNKDLVEGVGRYQGRMLILLDLPSVLAVEQS
ncbi:MAG: purine-binding chemotaxis protein CheW [Desulfuromonadales bacterium]|nr:purine-binding chemotaxis protein CheW [Desulfuromonadales bacterium]NIR33986.1 purine-binding chemotaxis protein CheW [Desulfuromonadales bacterium]NIS42658.1 purine-binding chemotaxis protein CheW [Desulfuromonadales bacterium]